MISTLDHTTVLVPDLDAGVAAYREIFAREPAFRTKSDGAQSAFFTLDNATLRITAPQGEASFGSSARAAHEENGEGLRCLTFGVDIIEQTHPRLNRPSLRPDETTHVTLKDLAVDTSRPWQRRRP